MLYEGGVFGYSSHSGFHKDLGNGDNTKTSTFVPFVVDILYAFTIYSFGYGEGSLSKSNPVCDLISQQQGCR